MILSSQSIRLHNLVTPCEDRGVFRGMSYGLSACGYDVRADLMHIGDPLVNSGVRRTVTTPDGPGVLLEPGQSILVPLDEYFQLPPNVAGLVKDKSTWARRGLLVNQAVLEPGWSGHGTVRVVNVGTEDLSIIDREPIAQVVFYWLDEPSSQPYTGKYQNQERGPQGPRYE